MDKALTIRVRRGPGHTVLTAAGEIDIACGDRCAVDPAGLSASEAAA